VNTILVVIPQRQKRKERLAKSAKALSVTVKRRTTQYTSYTSLTCRNFTFGGPARSDAIQPFFEGRYSNIQEAPSLTTLVLLGASQQGAEGAIQQAHKGLFGSDG
jgi:hypothetical protein